MIAIVVAAAILVGGLIGYQEFSRARAQNDVRSAVDALDRGNQASQGIQKSQSWAEARLSTIRYFDSLSPDEQAGFLLTFQGSAVSAAKRTFTDRAALEARLTQIAILDHELRNRRKPR